MLKEEYLQMDTLFSQLFYNQDLSKSIERDDLTGSGHHLPCSLP